MRDIKRATEGMDMRIPDPKELDQTIILPLIGILDLLGKLVEAGVNLMIRIKDSIAKYNKSAINDTVDDIGNLLIQRILLKELRNSGLDDGWYKLIFNSTRGVWLKNGKGVFVAINKVLLDSIKVKDPVEVLGRSGYEILETDNNYIRKDLVKAALLSTHAVEIAKKEDGIILEGLDGFKIYKCAIRDNDDNIIAYLGMMFEQDKYTESKIEIKRILKSELLESIGGNKGRL